MMTQKWEGSGVIAGFLQASHCLGHFLHEPLFKFLITNVSVSVFGLRQNAAARKETTKL